MLARVARHSGLGPLAPVTDQDTAEPVDVAAVVAGIEAEVARRRAAGEYPEDLLARLAVEFHDVTDERTSLEELAHIETVRPLLSTRAGLGSAGGVVKKPRRRSGGWGGRPVGGDQSRLTLPPLAEPRAPRRR